MARKAAAKKRSTKSSSKKTTRRSTTKRSTRKATKRAPAMASSMQIEMPMQKCQASMKWKGLGMFFVGFLVILNGWQGWLNWPLFIGLLVGLKGLWLYFKYG